jgi:hypothetical protein
MVFRNNWRWLFTSISAVAAFVLITASNVRNRIDWQEELAAQDPESVEI